MSRGTCKLVPKLASYVNVFRLNIPEVQTLGHKVNVLAKKYINKAILMTSNLSYQTCKDNLLKKTDNM